MKHNIYMLMLALVMGLGFVACSDNDPDGPTIFPVTSPERPVGHVVAEKLHQSLQHRFQV